MALPRFGDLQDVTDLARAGRRRASRHRALCVGPRSVDVLRPASPAQARASPCRPVSRGPQVAPRLAERTASNRGDDDRGCGATRRARPGVRAGPLDPDQRRAAPRTSRRDARRHQGLLRRDHGGSGARRPRRAGHDARHRDADRAGPARSTDCCGKAPRCSPAVANLVCRQLDVDLLLLAGTTQSIYTRYADDLVFSGDTVPDSSAVANIVERHGFALRDGAVLRADPRMQPVRHRSARV